MLRSDSKNYSNFKNLCDFLITSDLMI